MSSAASAAAGAGSGVHSMTSARTLSVLSAAPTLGALAGASFTVPLNEPWMSPASFTTRSSKFPPAEGGTVAQPVQQGQACDKSGSSNAEDSTGKLQPLPPPPASKGEAIAWGTWSPGVALEAGKEQLCVPRCGKTRWQLAIHKTVLEVGMR